MPFGVPDEYRDRFDDFEQALMADVEDLEKKWGLNIQDVHHNTALWVVLYAYTINECALRMEQHDEMWFDFTWFFKAILEAKFGDDYTINGNQLYFDLANLFMHNREQVLNLAYHGKEGAVLACIQNATEKSSTVVPAPGKNA